MMLYYPGADKSNSISVIHQSHFSVPSSWPSKMLRSERVPSMLPTATMWHGCREGPGSFSLQGAPYSDTYFFA